ncbi:MAG TPA: hypothetical protein VHE99_06855 [Gammaproteobacteria bacterium]|nr:hypothetical protein [Gammaproteobacteria bacterium]
MKYIDRRTKIILSVLFPILFIAWNVGFDLGVFGTVLYRNLMNAWMFAVATFFALLYFKVTGRTTVRFATLVIIFIPMLWPVIDALDQHLDNAYFNALVGIYYFVMACCLGFTLYIFLKLIKYDIFQPLNKRNLAFIVFVVALTTFVSYEVGLHHYLFFACGHFRISGEFIPPNCYRHPNPHFHTFYRKSWG